MSAPAGRLAAASLTLLAVVALAAGPARGEDWPVWRGPRGDGISNESVDPARWPKGGPPVLWRKSAGVGYATVSVAGGRAYTIGHENGTDTVWCLKADTGDPLWTHRYPCDARGGGFPGPAAAPVVDVQANRVYSVSREGHLFCLDAATGQVVWSKQPADLRITRGAPFWHGFTCHPVLDGERLILETGGQAGSVVALNKSTGDVLWQAGDERLGYATPAVADLDGRRTVVAFTGSGLLGLDVSDGQVLWRFPCEIEFQCAIVTPIVRGDRVFISSWYWQPGSALLKVQGGRVETLWQNPDFKNHANSSVLWEGHLYGFDGYFAKDHRLLKCLDFETGEEQWSQEGFGAGSLLCASGNLLILSETGELTVAEATPRGFRRLGRAQVLGGECWSPPVLANGRLYARNTAGDLVCVQVGSPTATAATANTPPAETSR